MSGFFSKLKERMVVPESQDISETKGDEYVELSEEGTGEEKAKITIRPYVIEDFEHIKPILDALRDGKTVALINIKPLKDKDLVELKRAINKLKNTCDAIEGDIAGFGEDWIAAVPSFAHIYRGKKEAKEETKEPSDVTEYS